MRIKVFVAMFGLAAATSIAAPVATDADTLILDRRAHMEEFNAAMQTLGQQIMSGNPDRTVVGEQAAHIHELATTMTAWFPAGTGTDSGHETAALPVIWEKPDEFSARVAALSAASAELADFAKAGDMRQLMSKAMAVDHACVTCHQSFQKRN